MDLAKYSSAFHAFKPLNFFNNKSSKRLKSLFQCSTVTSDFWAYVYCRSCLTLESSTCSLCASACGRGRATGGRWDTGCRPPQLRSSTRRLAPRPSPARCAPPQSPFASPRHGAAAACRAAHRSRGRTGKRGKAERFSLPY